MFVIVYEVVYHINNINTSSGKGFFIAHYIGIYGRVLHKESTRDNTLARQQESLPLWLVFLVANRPDCL